MLELLKQPWPWYVAGPLIGLVVPLLLLSGNKALGISSSLRHICAACIPANIPFFKYDWRKESWNLFFVAGILLGGIISATLLLNPNGIVITPELKNELDGYGITQHDGLLPAQLFSWNNLFSLQGLILTVVGGFLVGFGTRYASGCTSGHAIFGLSTLQWPSLVAMCCFMIGGIACSTLMMPWILSLFQS